MLTAAFQLPVVVWDEGRTEKTATATLTCVMSRNENAPRFEQDEYSATVNDRYEQGDEVRTVRASDDDQVSVTRTVRAGDDDQVSVTKMSNSDLNQVNTAVLCHGRLSHKLPEYLVLPNVKTPSKICQKVSNY